MPVVWSCNEWDPLEEVIVGSPLNARFPTPDRSTQLAEFPGRSLEEIPRGLFPQQIIEETEEDLDAFVAILEGLGITVKRPETWPHEAAFLQLLSSRHNAGHRRPNYRNTQCHPKPGAGNVQLSYDDGRIFEIGRKVVQRSQTHAFGFVVRRRSGKPLAT